MQGGLFNAEAFAAQAREERKRSIESVHMPPSALPSTSTRSSSDSGVSSTPGYKLLPGSTRASTAPAHPEASSPPPSGEAVTWMRDKIDQLAGEQGITYAADERDRVADVLLDAFGGFRARLRACDPHAPLGITVRSGGKPPAV